MADFKVCVWNAGLDVEMGGGMVQPASSFSILMVLVLMSMLCVRELGGGLSSRSRPNGNRRVACHPRDIRMSSCWMHDGCVV